MTYDVAVTDRVTLPDGSTPRILAVDRYPDPTGFPRLDFADVMTETVRFARRTALSDQSVPTYGSDTSLQAYIVRRPKKIIDATGQEVVQSAEIYTCDDVAGMVVHV